MIFLFFESQDTKPDKNDKKTDQTKARKLQGKMVQRCDKAGTLNHDPFQWSRQF